MQYFKFYSFEGVEVVVFKCTENDEDAVKFFAIGDLGTIEATPSFSTEEDRDYAWDNNSETFAKSLVQMIKDSFVSDE